MKTLAILCLLAGTATADDDDDPPAPPSHTQLVGFGIGGGHLPGRDLDVSGPSLGVEHRLGAGFRIAGEYEYLFVGHQKDGEMLHDGSGHRIDLSIRHAAIESPVFFKTLKLFLDAELGASLLVGNDGTNTMMDAAGFFGVRAGYDMIKLRESTKASPVWEPSVWARAMSTGRDQSYGWSAGIGLAWGN